jgi:hypothetical protein
MINNFIIIFKTQMDNNYNPIIVYVRNNKEDIMSNINNDTSNDKLLECFQKLIVTMERMNELNTSISNHMV